MEKLASIYFDIPALRPGTVGAYSLALVSFVLAVVLRVAIDPYLAGGVQFITFYPAVMVTTLLSGLGAGLFCAALSLAGSVYFVMPHDWSFYTLALNPGNIVLLVLFVLITLSNVILISGLRYAVERFKEREEKEHLLMREINHRAKNMLSVVAAIAHQTVAGNPEDFVGRFSERIQALSANQDLLVRNEWTGVEIADLVRTQLAHFAEVIGSRIAMQGPKLRLNPASAQAIGLAVHELATNAGKYGALSTNRGRLDICWGIDGDTLIMSWTEHDGPAVLAPKRHGFGTIVVKAMAERSVGGKVELDYASSGLAWRLICPTVNVLEPSKRDEQNSIDRKSELNAEAE